MVKLFEYLTWLSLESVTEFKISWTKINHFSDILQLKMYRISRNTVKNQKKRHKSCPIKPQSHSPLQPLSLSKAVSHKVINSPYKRKQLFKLRKRKVPMTLNELSEHLAPIAYIGKRQTSTSYQSDSEERSPPAEDSRVMDEEDRSDKEGSSKLRLRI